MSIIKKFNDWIGRLDVDKKLQDPKDLKLNWINEYFQLLSDLSSETKELDDISFSIDKRIYPCKAVRYSFGNAEDFEKCQKWSLKAKKIFDSETGYYAMFVFDYVDELQNCRNMAYNEYAWLYSEHGYYTRTAINFINLDKHRELLGFSPGDIYDINLYIVDKNNYMMAELVKNRTNLKWILNTSIERLNKQLVHRLTGKNTKSDHNGIYSTIQISHVEPVDKDTIVNWLKGLKQKLKREDIIVSYLEHERNKTTMSDDLDIQLLDEVEYFYEIYFKNIHSKRIKPNRYVYHYSKPEFREYIEENGLSAVRHSEGNWESVAHLAYPEAVFAVNNEEGVWAKGDRWQIDTQKIPNIWWEDLNFKHRSDLIMTFQSIPKDAIKLMNKNENN